MASRSGGNGVVIALVAFVFLFVISASLAVLFYTQGTAKDEKYTSAERTKRQFITAAQEGDKLFVDTKARGGSGDGAVFTQLKSDRDWFVDKLVGDATKSFQVVEQELKEFGIEAGESTLGRLRDMTTQLEDAERELDKLKRAQQAALAASKRELDQVNNDRTSNAETFDALRGRIGEIQDDYNTSLEATNTERDDLVAMHEKTKTDHQAEARALKAEIDAKDAEIQRLRARIASLLNLIERPDGPKMEYEHDGRVLEVNPRTNTVVINLGKSDRLILGMRFEIYDEQTGVRLAPNTQLGVPEEIPGKATVEVVRMLDDGRSASCRVIRQTFGQPLVTGDLVSNIVYDKDRKFRFYVSGDFDFNGDGRASSGERTRVKNLIEQWGGEVIDADQMPVDTDFLIMGRQPNLPRKLGEDPTEQDIQNYIEQRRKALEYLELVGQAQKLSVPMLTQNRFMTLIGYYQR